MSGHSEVVITTLLRRHSFVGQRTTGVVRNFSKQNRIHIQSIYKQFVHFNENCPAWSNWETLGRDRKVPEFFSFECCTQTR
jgi:hypothetical protein